MVRLLKEENQNLKKMLETLQKKLSGQGGVMGEDDKKAFLELKEEYEANQKMMGDMQKTFEEKLEEARKAENESIGTQVNISLPHLVVLDEDPQLCHKLNIFWINLLFTSEENMVILLLKLFYQE